MDNRKIFVGSLLYAAWSVLIGYILVQLIPWALIVAALVTGIYVGMNKGRSEGLITGLLTGLIGGSLLGISSIFVKTVYDIQLSIPITGFLNPIFGSVSDPLLVIPTAAVIGLIFGSIGGFLGSISELKTLFLFLTLFTLFLFYTAFDNVAWFWGKEPWNWSLAHVLTHWVDISVALVFSAFVTILSKILKIY